MESSAMQYNKLYYPGSGNDIKPLPVTKSVIYVDFAPKLPPFCKDKESVLYASGDRRSKRLINNH